MNLASQPLFLSQQVDSNVFFEIDDSGSMDWEVLPAPYYRACVYDRSHPGYSSCNKNLVTNGVLYVRSDGFSGEESIYYVFQNSDEWNTGYDSVEEYEDNSDKIVAHEWRVLSSAFNATYYNPRVQYSKWVDYETIAGVPAGYSSSFTAVKSDPMKGRAGYTDTRNLSTSSYLGASNGSGATYFEFHTWLDTHRWCELTGLTKPVVGSPGCNASKDHNRQNGANGWVDYWDEHLRYRVDVVSGTGTVTVDHITYGINNSGQLSQSSTNLATFSGNTVDPIGDVDGDGNIDGTGRTANDLVSQIATWYEFGRKRTFVARSTVGEVISQNPGLRYGLGLIKKVPGQTYTEGGKSLIAQVPMPASPTGPYNYNTLYTNLYYHDLNTEGTRSGGTPLRPGFKDVWDYFDNRTNPSNNPILFSCQHNFAILMTDGYYTSGQSISGIGDEDGDGKADMMSDLAYKLGLNSGYDLHTTLANNVPIKGSAGQTLLKQQHLVTFPMSFGVPGLLQDTDTVPDGWPDVNFRTVPPTAFTPVIDPSVQGNAAVIASTEWNGNRVDESGAEELPEKIDDMWHAAYNGNGKFISARNPSELLKGFEEIFNVISSIVSSSTALASTSGRAQGDALLYLAQFNSGDWTGNLRAVATLTNGGIGATVWETNNTLDGTAHTSRNIITYNPNTFSGIPFRFPASYDAPVAGEMDSVEIRALLSRAPYPANTTVAAEITANQNYGNALVNYLRGQTNQEGNTTTYKFRKRNHLLGDIVNSAPEYVGRPDEPFPNTIAPSPYSSFVIKYRNRTPMVYAGANDGMLHGFDSTAGTANSGKELLAYIPAMVYPKLPLLSDPNYGHEFYVNAPTNSMDVYDATFPSGDFRWQTLLVGALGTGGQGVYALNITDPSTFSEANAANISLWEFLHEDDVDLGYVMSKIPVVKLNYKGSSSSGRWGAIIANGYNSKEADGFQGRGSAVLFIVDAVTGALISKLDTNALGTATLANGLSGPAVVDVDGDWDADYVYAGDLQGNLWKFDISDALASNWKVAHKGVPHFRTDAGQPITVQPKVAKHPNGGYMIVFGTGKYLEVGDNIVTPSYPTQAFYGIWDDLEDPNSYKMLTTSDLFEQRITQENTQTIGGQTWGIRITTDAEPDYASNKPDMGWFIKLRNPNGNNYGERSVTDPQLASDASRVVFTTWVPTQDPCASGGYSWLMELSTLTGSRLDEPPFDLNSDGSYNLSDWVYEISSGDDVIPSGVRFEGLLQTPEIVKGASTGSGGCVSEGKYMSDTTGGIQTIQESADCTVGRVSWRHLN